VETVDEVLDQGVNRGSVEDGTVLVVLGELSEEGGHTLEDLEGQVRVGLPVEQELERAQG
jgi:hypothetical protein